MTTDDHVHATTETVATITLTPPHAPRAETPIYLAARHRLIAEQDTPCWVCGGREQRETHHRVIERSLADACDWRKVAADYPAAGIADQASFLAWVDGEQNLLVLCAAHHRSLEFGIHHLAGPVWTAQRYLLDGYRLAATPADAAQALADDTAALARAQKATE